MTDMDIFARAYNSGDEFAQVVAACEKLGDYCVIGGHGVNAYSHTVFTADLDLVIASDKLETVARDLVAQGFIREDFEYSVNFRKPGSRLMVQFSTDEFYRDFYQGAVTKQVLDMPVKVAAIEKIITGKIAAWQDASRRPTKRLKDELDLARLLEDNPGLRHLFPPKIVMTVFPPPSGRARELR
ncbi:MAG: hypothetical protein LBK60_05725 [Verrucomicrobiales bacterium]|jgi:hypothetical protein|nr:hypothetical protein [Verrucomicrobiales bacterium]